MNTGIYCIEHKESGKKYIGSAVDFNHRWWLHQHHLRKGSHPSKHLQAAWNKYGEEAFEFRKLLVCSKENLIMYEQRCIDGYEVCDREKGYNSDPTAGSRLGSKCSPETKERLRQANLGKKASAETRALLSKRHKGRKMPDWFPEFMRKLKTGSTHTTEARAKISATHKGKCEKLATVESRSKLTLEKAREIRALFASGEYTQKALAGIYGVCSAAISNVITGKRWSGPYDT